MKWFCVRVSVFVTIQNKIKARQKPKAWSVKTWKYYNANVCNPQGDTVSEVEVTLISKEKKKFWLSLHNVFLLSTPKRLLFWSY